MRIVWRKLFVFSAKKRCYVLKDQSRHGVAELVKQRKIASRILKKKIRFNPLRRHALPLFGGTISGNAIHDESHDLMCLPCATVDSNVNNANQLSEPVPKKGTFSLFYRSPENQSTNILHVNKFYTVKRVKDLIGERHMIESKLFWLSAHGKVMAEDNALHDYDICGDCTLDVNLRLLGGSGKKRKSAEAQDMTRDALNAKVYELNSICKCKKYADPGVDVSRSSCLLRFFEGSVDKSGDLIQSLITVTKLPGSDADQQELDQPFLQAFRNTITNLADVQKAALSDIEKRDQITQNLSELTTQGLEELSYGNVALKHSYTISDRATSFEEFDACRDTWRVVHGYSDRNMRDASRLIREMGGDIPAQISRDKFDDRTHHDITAQKAKEIYRLGSQQLCQLPQQH
mmetsp:Transcript_5003/g.8193  ORF Transcript_5003/g.8193 Transcript_5003/m.8193 type:complete len:403 (+) Transcript_5003:516-1724(+)